MSMYSIDKLKINFYSNFGGNVELPTIEVFHSTIISCKKEVEYYYVILQ